MFYLIFRTRFLHGKQTIAASQSFILLHSLQHDLSNIKPSHSLRFFCNISSNEHSFPVSYLINKCGFSSESTSRASNYIRFETPEKPDSLIAFLENHGFSESQIASLVRRQPTFDAFRRWGLSDQEIREAFRRYPSCMLVSEDKFTATMDFLVNKMGYSSTQVAKQYSIFARSLEKRIVPRALFFQELLSRGLVDSVKFSMVFDSSEK
ncbi:hypothetical protein F3Y22_tig00112226pilonHSYRG00035 [Hibiscus syriacus]|uniref:Mitochondrial transcription termination factor family protein n=1 Tax=Hibiscus syriacus TaxID=106335 RepID=A0A6A2X3N6_HIBSY|nr:hypothetical protein F3Y22_tig00112226pilonHSYRG00035 [Hibiscus syriacus]